MSDVVSAWFTGNAGIRWIQELFGLGHELPFRAFSLLGDTWGVIFVVGLGFWLFGRRTLHALLSMVIVATATKLMLTNVFSTGRPEGPGIVIYDRLEIGAFPSGHVHTAVALWGLLWRLRLVPAAVMLLLAFLAGLGRVYLGAHFVGDVVAGAASGFAVAWVYARYWPAACVWLERRGWTFALVLSGTVAVAAAAAMLLMGGSPRRYEIYGMVIAAAIALPIEHRWVRYEPTLASRWSRAGMMGVGLLGITGFLIWDRSQPDDALALGMLTAGLATLWTLLVVPALFASRNR